MTRQQMEQAALNQVFIQDVLPRIYNENTNVFDPFSRKYLIAKIKKGTWDITFVSQTNIDNFTDCIRNTNGKKYGRMVLDQVNGGGMAHMDNGDYNYFISTLDQMKKVSMKTRTIKEVLIPKYK